MNSGSRASSSTDLFNPSHYAAVRKPLLQAETMPTWCYTSDAFYTREVERIWRKAWNFLGHVDQVARPGDYVSLEFAGVPLIIVRGKDGVIRAFSNACRHRGTQLLDAGSGNCGTIVCPYHSWTYHLDGALAAAPEMQQTEASIPPAAADPAQAGKLGQFPVRLLRRHAPPLAQWLGGLPQAKGHALGNMMLARRKIFDMECN